MMASKGVVSPNEFLTKAEELFKSANEKKVKVHLTVKRYVKEDPVEGNLERDATKHPNYDISKLARTLESEDSSDKSYPLVLRIWCGSNAKKTKYSTIVETEEIDKFWQEYSSVVKRGMNGLIKKKKKKKNTSS
ncbi:Signal recognition particle subunit SRP14 [Nakaseomyces bracarensis]|uniref:Signal recognition particle subunit SRP14 n=1 Tax=Nakaseomyces bracarensis TaxID=273131 RepID=A0ABR4NV87_9SACH